jgi:L-iduronidase
VANEPGVTMLGYCWGDEMVGETVKNGTLTADNICGIMLNNKFDAEEAALHSVDSMLQYGGTGGGMEEDFLPHVTNGPNYFTGESGTRVDFLSIRHIKSTWDRSVGNATYWHAKIKSDYPSLADVPLMHTEDDWYYPWGSQGGMRASAAYPAMIATKMLLYQYAARLGDNTGGEPVNFVLSSPDNGFLGWWGNRTLMQQFNDMAHQGPVYLDPTDANKANAIELIKKPAFNGMVLMSLLGDTHIEADGYTSDGDDGWWNIDSTYFAEVLATRDDDGRVAAMVLNCRRNYMYCEDYKKTVSLTFHDLPFDSAVVAHYRIDSAHSNTFAVWQRMGGPYSPPTCTANVKTDIENIGYQGPIEPTAEQFATLRSRQELEYLDQQPPEKVTITGGTYTTEFTLPMPGVSMVVLSPKPGNPPAEVQNVQVTERPYNMTDERHMMVSWDDMDNKHIKTYEVLYSETENGPYTRVNEPDLLCTAFMHVKPAGSPDGYYKIRVVDYWDQTSDGNNPVAVTQRTSGALPQSVSVTMRGAGMVVHNPHSQPVRIRVFDALGRELFSQVVDARTETRLHSITETSGTGVQYIRIRGMKDGFVRHIRRMSVR